ncbi:MAG: glycoside hydrolase family 97 N-terminal domain-containing protein [Bryobacteraceae bacterium]
MAGLPALLLVALTTANAASDALDTRTVVSPNGQIEFRLFVAEPEPGDLPRIGYQVYNRGNRIMDTAFLGIDIFAQEPLLGENAGLIASSTGAGANGHYNWLAAKYMQNGTLGRLLNIEVRAYDDGIAFRYVIPPSTPLDPIEIADEATEFQNTAGVTITEVRHGSYPPMRLIPFNATEVITHLTQTPFRANAPLVCPWRVIVIGKEAGIIGDLNER